MKSIGLDIGTTSICAVVIDSENGEIFKTVTKNNNSFILSDKPFEKIQSAEIIMNTVTEILSGCFDSDVVSIGISGQMHGIVYTDKCGKAVSPLYIWQDGRGNEKMSDGMTYAEKMGSHSGYGLVTDYYNRVNKILPESACSISTIGDYVAMQLCGNTEPVIHITNAASMGCFDVKLNSFTINHAMIKEVATDFKVVGKYKNAEVTVAVGDNQSSFIGSVGNDGDILINVGTGSQVSVLSDKISKEVSLETRPFDGEKYLIAGCSLCGGRAFAMIERFFAEVAQEVTGEKCENAYPAIDRLLENFSGEPVEVDTRFCGTRYDASIRGCIKNIDDKNLTASSLAYGTLVGMAKELYDMFSLTQTKINCAVCSGNGIRKNKALQKIISQVFDCDIKIPAHKEEAAFGAALTSLIGTGRIDKSNLKDYIQYN